VPVAAVVDRSRFIDPALKPIADKVERGERLSFEDGATLFRSNDLNGIGTLADAVNTARHGNRVTFAANQHINPTNICTLRKTCVFCSYARLPKEEGAYRYTLEQTLAEAKSANSTMTREFHIVGGLDMKAGFEYYAEMFRALKREHPQVHIKALTAVEIAHVARISKMSVEEVLVGLREAGLDTMPGGGAEVFSPGVRATIADKKLSGEEYI
jgi:aminodeoxyfutalosine synthase